MPGDLIGEDRAGTAGCGLAQTSAVLRQGPFAILPERCPPRARIQEIALHMNGPFTVERRIFRPANGWLRVRRGEDLVSFALCLAVIFIGVMLMAQALEQYNRAQVMRAWPTALGRVTQVGIEPVPDDGELRWRPTVKYMYDAHGQTVISNGISLATARDNYSEADARRIVQPYAPNTTVVVFYNPEHPTEAILDHSLPKYAWLCLFAGLVLASAGGARLLLAYRVFWR